VASLDPDGPARLAGLSEGDVIIEFSGQPVSATDDLHRLLTEERIGQVLPITVVRGTEKIALQIVPQESPRRPS
jgi:S1-C subfamily serine protease